MKDINTVQRKNLSHQQKERIAEKQATRKREFASSDDQLSDDELDKLKIGQVIVKHGQNIIVNSEERIGVKCFSRKNLGNVVCGDEVLWRDIEGDQGIIEAIFDRQTILSRPDKNGREKPIVANITQLIIVLAHLPKPTGYLLDQYLISAEKIGINPIICLNKSDLMEKDEGKRFKGKFNHYLDLGYKIVQVSAKQRTNISLLKNFLQDNISVFVGQSGVGKSSLINCLLPDEMIEEGEISYSTGLGKHTTSFTKLYKLESGGEIIDSPGVRSFELSKMKKSDLELGYPEIRNLVGKCQFSNCTHNQEPNCAIQTAVEKGAIHPDRIASFLHLSSEL